jgi:hypothetical protein
VSTYYLLPCTCSRKIPVQLRQAGEIITCACGATLEVPTLLGIKSLEQAADISEKPKRSKTTWGTGHSITFLGVVIIIASVAIGIWLFLARPTDPYANFTPEQMEKVAQTSTPIQSWLLWKMLETRGLDRRKRGAEIYFSEQQTQYRIYWVILTIVSASGLVLTATGIILTNLNKTKPRPPTPH